ncbi:MAG TPA: hypothetical protein PKY59_03700 [Pyrinomonadaceae bacterium]|nr:hypothetical protein [Pyrinomonadaceae bacterium]
MKKIFTIFALVFVFCFNAAAQKSNDAIAKQIKQLKADKNITLNYDDGSKMSKIMVVTDNFSDSEANQFGLQAVNFALAFFYLGKTLENAPESITLTFWVMTKKPKFAESHNLEFVLGSEKLDLGEARYAAKPAQNMEYLNFKISPDEMEKITKASDVKLNLGKAVFKLTADQKKTLSNLVKILEKP